MRNKKKKNQKAGKRCIRLIVFVFAVVMSVQIVRIYQKDQEYVARQEELKQQLAEEEERQEELKQYEAYINSKQYVEDVAKTKLGLLYNNEIVFRMK